jgi:5-formyltetrahydrofolate cyclo-ligase
MRMSESHKKKIFKLIKPYKNIFIYVSKDDEIDTKNFIEELLAKNYTVIVPKIENDDLIPMKISSFDELKPGKYNILEPSNAPIVKKEDIDVFIIPGTKFDESRNRKGRGRGYFDRFLADVKGKKPIIGICMQKQLTSKIDTKPWDIPMDVVVSEEKTIDWCDLP